MPKGSVLYRVSYDVLEANDHTLFAENQADVQQTEIDAKKSDINVPKPSSMQPDRQCLGLPWIFWDLLCMIKEQQSLALTNEREEIKFRPKSFLNKISLEIASDKIINSDEAWRVVALNCFVFSVNLEQPMRTE